MFLYLSVYLLTAEGSRRYLPVQEVCRRDVSRGDTLQLRRCIGEKTHDPWAEAAKQGGYRTGRDVGPGERLGGVASIASDRSKETQGTMLADMKALGIDQEMVMDRSQ